MQHRDTYDYSSLLRSAGLRATPGRIELLEVLNKEPNPLTAHQIEQKLGGLMNQVTVYRSLEALLKAKIVKRVNLEQDHACFEILVGRKHHHHAVCRNCGHIEDIEVPHTAHPEKEALKQAKTFKFVDGYSLEFFGLCKKCTTNN